MLHLSRAMRIRQLRELARLYDVQLSYEDATGKRREASHDALTAVLQKRIPEGLSFEEALAVKKKRSGELEPVYVAWEGRLANAPATAEVELEDGDTWLPGTRLPYGYHTLRVGQSDALVISAPKKAHVPEEKTWGIFAPLYGAHVTPEKKEGDLSDMRAYLDWVARIGGGVVATLPMLAAFDDEPSPYSPVSRLFWNERYLDLERLPEWEGGDPASNWRASLEEMAKRIERDAAFDLFVERAWPYAWFRASIDRGVDAWESTLPSSWLDVGRDPLVRYHLYVQYRMAEQMRQISQEARRSGPGLYLDFPLGVAGGGYDVWKYPEVFVRGVSVGAPPDAFFTKGQSWGFPPFDPDTNRATRYRYFRAAIRHHAEHAGILRLDHVMGLHRLFWIPEGAEAKDGVYVRYPDEEMLAIINVESHRFRCVVVGEDLGTVPEYVPRAMARHGLRSMYVVQYEARAGYPPLRDVPRTSIASLNTHDMPTFAAWWSGLDIDDRVQQGLMDDETAVQERAARVESRALVRTMLGMPPAEADDLDDGMEALERLLVHLASSDAEVMLVNLEDLWGETTPQNVPGVPDRSWRQRLRLSLEETVADERIGRILDAVNGARLASSADGT